MTIPKPIRDALGWRPGAVLDVAAAEGAGDDRPAALTVLLEVLTAPGLSLVRYSLAVPVLIWVDRDRTYFGEVGPDDLQGAAAGELTVDLGDHEVADVLDHRRRRARPRRLDRH